VPGAPLVNRERSIREVPGGQGSRWRVRWPRFRAAHPRTEGGPAGRGQVDVCLPDGQTCLTALPRPPAGTPPAEHRCDTAPPAPRWCPARPLPPPTATSWPQPATTAWAAPSRTRPALGLLVMDGSPLRHQPGHVRNRTGLIATLDTTLPEYPSAHQTSLLTA